MLGIARALAVQPRLLMLDEPLGGMNTDEITFTMDIMAKVRGLGMTILVIEHNMQILHLCDSVVAINFGQKLAKAPSKISGTIRMSSRPTWESKMLLKVGNLTVHYGKAVALENVSMEVAEGSVVTLVGANGAGKTTLLRRCQA